MRLLDRALIEAGLGERHAEKVVVGGRLVNVVTGEIYDADVAIYGTRVAAVGDVESHIGPETETIDAGGYFLVPGLIDGHIHCEVTKLSMTMFARLVLPRGTTSIVTALDQIAGIDGLRGVRDFLGEAAMTPLKVHYGMPSKLPYTIPSSTLAHTFGPREAAIAAGWEATVGVWETGPETVLGSPDGGTGPDKEVARTMRLAEERRLQTFGSAPILRGDRLSGFVGAGIRSDHESYTAEESLEKLRDGLYLMIRESSIVKFLTENIRVVTEVGVETRRIAFCTDDVTASDVISHGHLDEVVRKAIACGVEPVSAVQMATLNCAEIYRIDHKVGSITPGRLADILLVDDLKRFKVSRVVASGELVASDGSMTARPRRLPRRSRLTRSMKVKPFARADLAVKSSLPSGRVRAIAMRIEKGAPFVRRRQLVSLRLRGGVVQPDPSQDVSYVAAVERHRRTGNIAVAFISGFGISEGALASSVSPDDNNILSIGSSSEEVEHAVKHVVEMGGGQTAVRRGKVLASIPLPLGGIVSDAEPEEMARMEAELDAAARGLGCELPSPFMSMIFLSITATPELALIDRGLVDTASLKVISPIIGPG
ncbi:MAG: adenine deaminase C-terminal domain-containing protein [Nitrososphaerales archaeon]